MGRVARVRVNRARPISLLLPFLLGLPAFAAAQQEEQQVPWVVIDGPEPHRYDDLLSAPHLVVLEDGTYVASFEHAGHYNANLGTYVCRSIDRGRTWVRVAKLDGPRNSSLFYVGDRLYLMGVVGSGRLNPGPVIIRSSSDQGSTWTTPLDAAIGLLLADRDIESDFLPAFFSGDRIWRPFARSRPVDGGRLRAHAVVVSAALDSDLLRAESWCWSEELALDEKAIGVAGSAMIDGPERNPHLILRKYGVHVVGCAEVSSDGKALRKLEDCASTIPKGAAGWNPIRDAAADFLLVLTRRLDPEDPWNGLMLSSSSDMITWTPRTFLVNDSREGSRYGACDWEIEGDDLLIVASADMLGAEQKRKHVFMFLRVPSYRDRTLETAPLWGSLPSK